MGVGYRRFREVSGGKSEDSCGKRVFIEKGGVWVLLREDFWELYGVFEENGDFRKSYIHARLGVWEFWMKKKGFSIQVSL